MRCLKFGLTAVTGLMILYIMITMMPQKAVQSDNTHQYVQKSSVQGSTEPAADAGSAETETKANAASASATNRMAKNTARAIPPHTSWDVPDTRTFHSVQPSNAQAAYVGSKLFVPKNDILVTGPESGDEPEPEGEPAETAESSILPASSSDSPYLDTLKLMKDQDSRIQTVIDHSTDYPEDLLKILTNNIETLDFVLEYPKKKNVKSADTIGKVKKGTIPLLIQWDERWGYSPYGGSIIAVSGCGPTCLAMVASGLTGRNDITPASVAAYSMENGFLTEQYDTKWDLMTYGCEAFGISGTTLSLSEDAMRSTLESGSPIICSVRPGDFTNGGHFLVITGYKDGKFRLHDPNSKIRSEMLWEYERLAGQIKNLWGFRLMDREVMEG